MLEAKIQISEFARFAQNYAVRLSEFVRKGLRPKGVRPFLEICEGRRCEWISLARITRRQWGRITTGELVEELVKGSVGDMSVNMLVSMFDVNDIAAQDSELVYRNSRDRHELVNRDVVAVGVYFLVK